MNSEIKEEFEESSDVETERDMAVTTREEMQDSLDIGSTSTIKNQFLTPNKKLRFVNYNLDTKKIKTLDSFDKEMHIRKNEKSNRKSVNQLTIRNKF